PASAYRDRRIDCDIVAGLEDDGGASVQGSGQEARGDGKGLELGHGVRESAGVRVADCHPASLLVIKSCQESLICGILSYNRMPVDGPSHETVLRRDHAEAVQCLPRRSADPCHRPATSIPTPTQDD